MNILEVNELSLALDGQQNLLHDLSLSVKRGSFNVIAGRNGAGKSLLLHTLKGLYPISRGTILVDHVDLSRRKKERNKRLALVFQDAENQIVGQTVKRDLLFGLENLRLDKQESERRIVEITRLLELTSLLERPVQALSGGELRRVALAGVLVMEPEIIMLDEPFANLDDEGILQILRSLLQLQQRGHTLLVVTHDLEKILAHADTLILMHQGTVVASDQVESVLPLLERYGVRRPRTKNSLMAIEEMSYLC